MFNNNAVAFKKGEPPEGYNIVNLQLKQCPLENLFKPQWFGYMKSKDSRYSYGGIRIAEYMIFSHSLSNDVRTSIYSAFRTKWFGDDRSVLPLRNLLVGADAQLTVPWHDVTLAGTLSIGGRLNVDALSVSTLELTAEGADIFGSLEVSQDASIVVEVSADGGMASLSAKSLSLAGGGTVAFSGKSGQKPAIGEWPILTGEKISGSFEDWTFDASSVNCVSVCLKVKDDGLYAVVSPKGTVFLIR